ncbi:MAG: methyltransferase domain-containing protein [Betaproteobacteria bacterium]|nr:methyltransferase domain-containing protein [Betaproteobacteria bacterium]
MAHLGGMLLVAGVAAAAFAQDYGDVPYVQTPRNIVDTMLGLAKVRADDYLIDLGSGDGRLVITAAKKYGARGFGVDLDQRLVELGNANAAKAGVADRAVFYQRDLHETDVSPATIVTLYLLPEVNLMIRPKLLATLRAGTRIVSHDYHMGVWAPDDQTELEAPGKTVGSSKRSKIFYWVVPGNAAGRWYWTVTRDGKPAVFELTLDQTFQKLAGTLTIGARRASLESVTLEGDRIALVGASEAGSSRTRYEFSGRIVSHVIEGQGRIIRGEQRQALSWNAARIELWDPKHFALRNVPPCREMGVPCGAR